MGAHTLIRFRQIEVQLREAAERTLADPAATLVAKREARRTLHETLLEAQRRHRAKKAKDALGPQPHRQDFASEAEFVTARDAYRIGLDRLACEEVLDNPNSLGKRNLARRTLELIEKQERLRGTVPVTRRAKPESRIAQPAAPGVQAQPDDTVSAEIQRFFDGDGVGEPERSEPSGSLREPAPASHAPRAPQLFCEKHACPIEICGCNETCPLCLQPRNICGHRKGEK